MSSAGMPLRGELSSPGTEQQVLLPATPEPSRVCLPGVRAPLLCFPPGNPKCFIICQCLSLSLVPSGVYMMSGVHCLWKRGSCFGQLSGLPVTCLLALPTKTVSCGAAAVRLHIQLQLNNLLCALSVYDFSFKGPFK